ncbi:unnamed protein product [Diamesa tonsa]
MDLTMKDIWFLIGVTLIVNTESSSPLNFYQNVVVPSNLIVTAGESVNIKIKVTVSEQVECFYQAPGQKLTNIPNDRVNYSSTEKCGIRINGILKSDTGVWKLMYKSKDNVIKGVSVIEVIDKIDTTIDQKVYSPTDDFTPTDRELDYCYVSKDSGIRKYAEIDNNACKIPKDLQEELETGLWTVHVGTKGQINEVTYKIEIQSADDNFGLNLVDGIGVDRYQYYGDGMKNGDCGMEIMNPNAGHMTQWKCYIGMMDVDDAANVKIADVNKRIYKYSAIMDASDDWESLKIINTDDTIYVVNESTAVIECNSNNPFDYCWIQHPTGKIISVSDKKKKDETDDFHYHGEGFHLGECVVTIKMLTYADAGDWKCGVGRSKEGSKEAIKMFKVEVVDTALKAMTKQVEDVTSNAVHLTCQSIPLRTPLQSCHFLKPDGTGFSINEKTTEAEAIDGLYYFNPNRKLSDGFCTVIIKKLNPKHTGKWICSGKLLGIDEEHYDSIYVIVDKTRYASISFLSIVIVLPTLTFIALVMFGYKKYRQRQQGQSERMDRVSMNSVASNNSSDSEVSISNGRIFTTNIIS